MKGETVDLAICALRLSALGAANASSLGGLDEPTVKAMFRRLDSDLERIAELHEKEIATHLAKAAQPVEAVDIGVGRDIVKRLRDTPNWLKEAWGDFKSAGANKYDRAPKEAADYIETLLSALAHPRANLTAEPLIVPQLPYGSESKPYPDFSIMCPAIDDIVNRFLSWELPSDVCADPVACKPDCEWPRYGTNLLTHAQAEAMIEHVLADAAKDGWFAGTEDADGNALVTLRADDPRLAHPRPTGAPVEVSNVAKKLLDALRADMAEGFGKISVSCSALELVCEHIVVGEKS